jgi:hypothetical protein
LNEAIGVESLKAAKEASNQNIESESVVDKVFSGIKGMLGKGMDMAGLV